MPDDKLASAKKVNKINKSYRNLENRHLSNRMKSDAGFDQGEGSDGCGGDILGIKAAVEAFQAYVSFPG